MTQNDIHIFKRLKRAAIKPYHIFELPQNHIYEHLGNIYRFDAHESYPTRRVSLDVVLVGKV